MLGTVLAAAGHREDADRELRTSLEILDEIQSRPELAQTLLAYGRFKLADDAGGGRAMIERAALAHSRVSHSRATRELPI